MNSVDCDNPFQQNHDIYESPDTDSPREGLSSDKDLEGGRASGGKPAPFELFYQGLSEKRRSELTGLTVLMLQTARTSGFFVWDIGYLCDRFRKTFHPYFSFNLYNSNYKITYLPDDKKVSNSPTSIDYTDTDQVTSDLAEATEMLVRKTESDKTKGNPEVFFDTLKFRLSTLPLYDINFNWGVNLEIAQKLTELFRKFDYKFKKAIDKEGVIDDQIVDFENKFWKIYEPTLELTPLKLSLGKILKTSVKKIFAFGCLSASMAPSFFNGNIMDVIVCFVLGALAGGCSIVFSKYKYSLHWVHDFFVPFVTSFIVLLLAGCLNRNLDFPNWTVNYWPCVLAINIWTLPGFSMVIGIMEFSYGGMKVGLYKFFQGLFVAILISLAFILSIQSFVTLNIFAWNKEFLRNEAIEASQFPDWIKIACFIPFGLSCSYIYNTCKTILNYVLPILFLIGSQLFSKLLNRTFGLSALVNTFITYFVTTIINCIVCGICNINYLVCLFVYMLPAVPGSSAVGAIVGSIFEYKIIQDSSVHLRKISPLLLNGKPNIVAQDLDGSGATLIDDPAADKKYLDTGIKSVKLPGFFPTSGLGEASFSGIVSGVSMYLGIATYNIIKTPFIAYLDSWPYYASKMLN